MSGLRELTEAEGLQYPGALAEVLVDCVEGGASVSFMPPFSRADAESFYRKVIGGVRQGERILLAAFIDARLVGTVQVQFAAAPNQPHRGDVAKLLVLRSARGQGVAGRLMRHAEQAGRKAVHAAWLDASESSRSMRSIPTEAAATSPSSANNCYCFRLTLTN